MAKAYYTHAWVEHDALLNKELASCVAANATCLSFPLTVLPCYLFPDRSSSSSGQNWTISILIWAEAKIKRVSRLLPLWERIISLLYSFNFNIHWSSSRRLHRCCGFCLRVVNFAWLPDLTNQDGDPHNASWRVFKTGTPQMSEFHHRCFTFTFGEAFIHVRQSP